MTLPRRGLAAALTFGVLLTPAACAPAAFAADTTLTPTALTQIEVGASEDTWGDKLNANAATINGWFDNAGGTPALKVGNGGTGAKTLTGLLKGNGASAFTAATAGTDYYAPGSTDVTVADGGTGSSTAAGARTNLGLGSAATQNTGTSGANIPLLNGANTYSAKQVFGSGINATAAAKTISSGTITFTSSYLTVDTESAAAADNLDTISGGVTGDIVIIRQLTDSRDVTITNAGNIRVSGSGLNLADANSAAVFVYTGAVWICAGFSINS